MPDEDTPPETPAGPTETFTSDTPVAAIAEAPEEQVIAQAQNPDAVDKLIKQERQTAKEAKARAKQLEEEKRAQEEASKPLEEQVAAAVERAAAAELRATRIAVAAKAGLPFDFADRLKGTTEEELLADAESLKSYVAAPAAPAIPPEGGVRTTPPETPDPVQGHNDLILHLLSGNDRNGNAALVPRSNPLAGLEPAPEGDE